MHSLIFGISDVERLSSPQIDNKFLLMQRRCRGGMLLGLLMFILAKWRKKPMVDPIEANALHGGRLSLTDSIIVAVQNLISNGFGASVGLEAGYTQLASGIASKLGISSCSFAARICAPWSAAARPAPSPPPSTHR
jgi:CIC family chloride channel protein